MTTPGLPQAPDGAWVIGSDYGSTIDPDSVLPSITGQTLEVFEEAQENMHGQYNDRLDSHAALINSLTNDIELLNGIPAYGAAYMSYNIWVVSDNPIMPFNAQLGPAKRVTVLGAGSTTDGRLRGIDPGLWQMSAFVHGDVTSYTGNGAMRMDMCVDVYNDAGLMLQYIQSPVQDADPDGAITNTFMFVVPFGVTYFDAYVRTYSVAWRQFRGGTRYSALSLLRISEDVQHATPTPTVPDGNAPPE
ncbi:hypothetical protein IU485_28090 [Nocardia cyriacigeorgica]|uniref:hypothetical protein n=1 Tax=Nocardia cyriacigeorgica TaxID=135487 RepID=UPI001894CD65|nr:hypothetical protein [Nocardia cyriacigeorgica]MBF6085234.1 hypothetical protein [Nocardia cyriacigeorgica]